MSGVSLAIVFATMSVVAVHSAGNMALLIALATTLRGNRMTAGCTCWP